MVTSLTCGIAFLTPADTFLAQSFIHLSLRILSYATRLESAQIANERCNVLRAEVKLPPFSSVRTSRHSRSASLRLGEPAAQLVSRPCLTPAGAPAYLAGAEKGAMSPRSVRRYY